MSDSLFSLSGKITLVSGGSRGIGRELAKGFAERGAKVVITGRKEETLRETAQQLSTAENEVTYIVCDVAKPDDIPPLVETMVSRHGRIDVLLNVAGVNQRKKLENFTEAEFDAILDINLKGAFLLAQAVGRQMIAQKSGAMVHIDSLNTYAPLKGVVPYAMSKAGVSMMTRGMAMEWGPHNVRVNAIAPGFILTDLNRKLWSQPTMQTWGHANTPLGRLGSVQDLVGTAVFLASDASAFMTGQVLYVDGGISAGIIWPIDLENPPPTK
ncbi:MAG: glucose 1-dehydrogenase [Planctomycetaceae bacterium]|nr:glucose 1-dehydrogenase [Planctomycetaceae bacterium]